MSNAQRGEVSFEALGQSWTMKLGTNAMCELEDRTGKTIVEIGDMLDNEKSFSMGLLRDIFMCALLDHHEDVSKKEAGRIIDDLGMKVAVDKVRDSFLKALPEAEAPTKGNRKAARS